MSKRPQIGRLATQSARAKSLLVNLPQDLPKKRYIPMRQGKWSPAYKQTNTDQIERYLIKRFGDIPVSKLDSFQIQIWLNDLAEEYSESVVRSCYSNIRAITAMARKQKFLKEDPGEDVTMPQTKPVEKPVMTQD